MPPEQRYLNKMTTATKAAERRCGSRGLAPGGEVIPERSEQTSSLCKMLHFPMEGRIVQTHFFVLHQVTHTAARNFSQQGAYLRSRQKSYQDFGQAGGSQSAPVYRFMHGVSSRVIILVLDSDATLSKKSDTSHSTGHCLFQVIPPPPRCSAAALSAQRACSSESRRANLSSSFSPAPSPHPGQARPGFGTPRELLGPKRPRSQSSIEHPFAVESFARSSRGLH